MRKFAAGILVTLLCVSCFALSACTDTKSPEDTVKDDFAPFAGEWECEDNPLNDPDNYTGYLKLKITADGQFDMYDSEEGNPSLKGKLTILSDKELQFTLREGSDFEPPSVWSDMDKIQILTYKFKSEEKLYLTYEFESEDEEDTVVCTLIFDKVKK